MEIQKIKMPKEAALEEWKKYNELLKKRKDKYLQDMKKAMYQLKQGHELLDIYVVMEKTGVNKEHQPKLAIARADWKKVFFRKKDTGRGFFSGKQTDWYTSPDGHIDMPPETFMNWARTQDDITMKDNTIRKADRWNIANQDLKATVPIIPSHLYPEGELKNYYILWEVDVWTDIKPPKKDDPILLKRITENLFVILGAWDVTDLEQSIIRGL